VRKALIAMLLLGGCAADPLWAECDGAGSCGGGYRCIPRAYDPLGEPAGDYCALECGADSECAEMGGWCRLGVCRIIAECEAETPCPEGFQCAYGGNTCEP
jgi:hypothetical protein